MRKPKATPNTKIQLVRKATTRTSRKGGVLSGTAVRRIQRRYEVLELRKKGHTYEEIGKALNILPDVAREDVRVLMTGTVLKNEESVDELREIQSQRLDGLLKVYYPLATENTTRVHVNRKTGEETIVDTPPDPEYAAICLRLQDQQAKLKGTNKPDQKEVAVTGVREYVGIDLDKV